MSASGKSPAVSKEPSFVIEANFLSNPPLKNGLMFLTGAVNGSYENEFKGEFISFFQMANQGELPIKIRIESDGTLQSKEGAAASANVVKTGICGHTDYMVLQESSLIPLEMIQKIDKTKVSMIYVNINLASDIKDPLKVAWCIAHELAVHAMPLCKHNQAVIEAISQLGGMKATAVEAPMATAAAGSDSAAAAAVAPAPASEVSDTKSVQSDKSASALEKLLAGPLHPDTQHVLQVQLGDQNYLQAWRQLAQHAIAKYSGQPAVLKKINEHFESDIVGYYRGLLANSPNAVRDQSALKSLMTKMGGENLLKLNP